MTDAILMNRAKVRLSFLPSLLYLLLTEKPLKQAILLTGAILKAIQPDETDVERRELERMVAEANQKRKDKGKAPKKK